MRGYGYTPYFVEGDDPAKMHQLLARTLDLVVGEIKAIQADARKNGFQRRPRWPMIVFRVMDVIDRLPQLDARAAYLKQALRENLERQPPSILRYRTATRNKALFKQSGERDSQVQCRKEVQR